MARLKNSFTAKSNKKPPVLDAGTLSSGSLPRSAAPRDLTATLLSHTAVNPVSQAINFGILHTKATPVSSSSGSSWTSLLSVASGGVSSALGGGLFSSGGFGFVSKLLSLFGGGKHTPAAPVAFQSPVTRQKSLNVTVPGASSSVSLGVHPLSPQAQASGVYQQTGSTVPDHHSQSMQVVQIVKQALLTSSSLNDVIAEI